MLVGEKRGREGEGEREREWGTERGRERERERGRMEIMNVHPIVHTRLQCNAATWLVAWVQRFRCEVSTIQYNQTHHLGALPPDSSNKLDEGRGILNLHSGNSCSDEADE